MMLPTETAEEIRSKYTERLIELETLEVERATFEDVSTESAAEMYLHLMALYLIENDLPNAKFVWKRTPDSMKKAPAMSGLHRVFLALWTRDFPLIYTGLNGTSWPANLQPLIADLRSLTVLRARNLLSQSYADVSQEDFCTLMGVPADGVASACAELGWTLNEGRVTPVKPPAPAEQPLLSEAHLAKLAEFISFLEC
ncbi:COP9 signalosome complex subunit 8-like [Tropilaelaps mercedesae]|uniref:COP9 signalosome complex subunit 8-like n=1 Tax=Tropilaelaps mercedesae TaxID=418985 RepID=A0A1V9X960_9ACAR|nr:COP9 signalosome complex subunit 8-like [Tropilaelaps mercedesae]